MSKYNNLVFAGLVMGLLLLISSRVYGQENVDLSKIRNQRGIAWQPNGHILALGGIIDDQTGFWLYDVEANTVDRINTTGSVSDISWSADGNKIAGMVGSSATANFVYEIYDVSSKQLISSFEQQNAEDKQLYWSTDSTLVASVDADHIDIRSVTNGNLIISLSYPKIGSPYSIKSAGWDSERQRAYALRSDNSVLVWNTQNGTLLQEIPLQDYSAELSLSPDGTTFAIAGAEGKITLFDALTGSSLMTLQSSTNKVIRDVVWNLNSDLLASYSFGKVIEIWNPTTGERLDSWIADPLIRWGTITWKPNSSQLVYSMGDGAPIFHDVTLTLPTQTPSPTAAS